jgi:hypothetical protein
MTDTPGNLGASNLLGDVDLKTPRPETRAEANARLGEMLSQEKYLKPQNADDAREIAAARMAATRFDPAELGVGVRPVESAVALAEHEMVRARMERDQEVETVGRLNDWAPEVRQHFKENRPITPAQRAEAERTVEAYRSDPYYRGLLAKGDPLARNISSIARAMLSLPVSEAK